MEEEAHESHNVAVIVVEGNYLKDLGINCSDHVHFNSVRCSKCQRKRRTCWLSKPLAFYLPSNFVWKKRKMDKTYLIPACATVTLLVGHSEVMDALSSVSVVQLPAFSLQLCLYRHFCIGKNAEKGEPFALLVGKQIGAATVGSIMELPQKIKNRSALWPSNSTSGKLSKETQNTNLKEHKHPYVHCSVFYNSQDLEAAQVCTSWWIDNTTMGHLHKELLTQP